MSRAVARAAVLTALAATGPLASASQASPHVMPTAASIGVVGRPAAGAGPLLYGGGVGGIGVETAPRVYLVFYGSEWGTGTLGSTDWTFSADGSNEAPYLQRFMRGLFGAQDTWSTSTTQYCQGVATGAKGCKRRQHPVFTTHPASSPLAGVWADQSRAAGAAPSDASLGQEAVRAAQHFGNNSAASNASVQYVIVLANGVVPSGFGSIYCAWHDYTADVGVSSPVGNVAFTNLPYIPSAGQGCGRNFVNGGSAGLLDGVSMVAGHEYTETISDQFPSGGWTDRTGAENADKCVWISSGQGKAANLTLSTGTFAVQSLWSNSFNSNAGGCVIFYQSKANQH